MIRIQRKWCFESGVLKPSIPNGHFYPRKGIRLVNHTSVTPSLDFDGFLIG